MPQEKHIFVENGRMFNGEDVQVIFNCETKRMPIGCPHARKGFGKTFIVPRIMKIDEKIVCLDCVFHAIHEDHKKA